MLSAGDVAISILSFVEETCDQGGRKKFAVLETKRGTDVLEILPEMRKLTVERKKGEGEGLGGSNTARVALDVKAVSVKVKLDLQEQQNGGALRNTGSVSGPRFCEECWQVGKKKRRALVRKEWGQRRRTIVPAERKERGCGREQGGCELHSKCGEQFG